MAEQFAFDEGSAKGGAVHGDERTIGAAALLVNPRAINSLPTPVSPSSSTVVSRGSHLCGENGPL